MQQQASDEPIEDTQEEQTCAEPAQPQEPMTCSVPEFAAILGISRDRAYEMVNSMFPPPGFKVGKGYRIIKSRIPEYADQLYEREIAMRKGRR